MLMATTQTKRKTPWPPLRDLKAELARKGLTNKEVARRIGIGRDYFSQVLCGRAPLNERLARDISLATGIPLSVIVPGRGDGGKETTGR